MSFLLDEHGLKSYAESDSCTYRPTVTRELHKGDGKLKEVDP